MAITETSLYAHCSSSNFPLTCPTDQACANSLDSIVCPRKSARLARDSTTPLKEESLCSHPDLLSVNNQCLKARKILDYIRKLIRQEILCQEHEQILDQALFQLQSVYHYSSSSVENSDQSTDELANQTDQALVYSFIQLKKIAQCSECRNSVRITSKEQATYKATPVTRVNQVGLIWALLRNWCDIFRSRRSRLDAKRLPKQTSVQCENHQANGLGAKCPSVERSPDKIDKAAYCWQWLLTQTDSLDPNHHEGSVDLTRKVLSKPLDTATHRNANESCGENSTKYIRQSTPSQTVCPSQRRSRSMSDSTVHVLQRIAQRPNATKPFESLGSQSTVSKFPARIMRTRRKSTPSILSNEDDTSSQSPKSKSARCVQLPHHVARRSRDPGMSHRNPIHQQSAIWQEPLKTKPDTSYTFRTIPSNRVNGTNTHKSTNFSSKQPVYCARSPQYQCKSPSEANLRTIDFLQSLSPNMNVVPPPNHNPFVIKRVVH